ncbi:tRNA pseudouridine(55) synthase TruB [Lacisediminihabitans profunda]|uniref:tRNA pseudouridine synthase B n=1 Tax=Lacisediminihabitans profunda TaxID=2594790 RepID=A0A5C8UYU9_9MICO|nr:tRNA pseudouridine(55) synthase TruB [Lacisediminihabitans profunda]TXN32798.1 tRNA pseudouridine(55) synthase TruB [Lacisediminihabitans profunda]
MSAAGRSGILLVDKPQGITSHDAVSRTRKRAGTRKVGHAGTLDPMATGLLVLGINSSTRLLTYLVGLDKEYFATIRLGAATSTDDAEGEVTSTAPPGAVAALDGAAIASALEPLTGEISQVPSSVSAIKVDGKRAYTLARAGETVELAARTVTVSALEVLDSRAAGDYLDVDVRVECSSGTYIRAIARDLGAALGVGGHLTALRRTRIGPFSVADAADLETMDVATALLGPADVASRLFDTYPLTESQAIDLGHGKRLVDDEWSGGAGPLAAIAPDGRLVGLIGFDGHTAKPLVNFPTDEVTA